MQIDREYLEKRLAELAGQEMALQSNLAAVNGAKQAVQYMLGDLAREEQAQAAAAAATELSAAEGERPLVN